MSTLNFSIGILSWQGYDSLVNSLISYQKNGLSQLTNQKFICLPEYTEEGLKIAEKFNYKPILIKKNEGILHGFKTLAEQIFYPLMLVIGEKECLKNEYTLINRITREQNKYNKKELNQYLKKFNFTKSPEIKILI